jgi:FAD/FMN-containing dehydrogenase
VRSSADPHESSGLWELRHAASPIIAAMSDTVKSMQIIEDGAVPPARLADYVREIRRILAASQFRGVIFGHAGDGHVHVNVLVDTREPDWRKRVESLFADAVTLTSSLGGTMTGEHGDGRLRAAAMGRMWPAATLEQFRAVKDAFDPAGIFNPGVKFAAPDAPPLGADIKYDPGIEPLAPSARHVLDRVQRDRAWNRPRLELLDEELRR